MHYEKSSNLILMIFGLLFLQAIFGGVKWGNQEYFKMLFLITVKYQINGARLNIKGNPLILSQIPGNIQKLQGYRGTICNVAEAETLKRLLNDESSPTFQLIIMH